MRHLWIGLGFILAFTLIWHFQRRAELGLEDTRTRVEAQKELARMQIDFRKWGAREQAGRSRGAPY